MPITTVADDISFIIFQRKQVLTFHVQAEDSHEISRLIFSEKKKINKNFRMSSVKTFNGALRVNFRAQLSKALLAYNSL